MDNKAWKVGDKILCVKSNYEQQVIAGKEYIIDGFGCCPACGDPTIFIEGIEFIGDSWCNCCYKEVDVRLHYSRSRFIRPDLSSLIQYREEISVREISVPNELKELKNLEN